jgi:DNA-binding NarL/FixJ family response regulator
MNDQPVPVLLTRFEDLIARGLRALIDEQPSLELVAYDIPHAALMAALERHRPAVAIVDFAALTSTAEVRAVRSAFPETMLLVLTSRPTASESRQLLAFGATACLPKSAQARDVVHAIHLASRGLQVLPAVSGEPRYTQGPEPLTAREAEVLELLHAGRTNAQIAATLHVSVETVRTHARHLYRKLGVRSRRELRVEHPRTG